MVGEKFGQLEVLNEVENVMDSPTLSLWECHCEICGEVTSKRGYELITPDVLLSCGCDDNLVLSPLHIPLTTFLRGQSQAGLIKIILEIIEDFSIRGKVFTIKEH